MSVAMSKPSRPWLEIAYELDNLKDRTKTFALAQELNRALSEQAPGHKEENYDEKVDQASTTR
jgi:hypothetical protein